MDPELAASQMLTGLTPGKVSQLIRGQVSIWSGFWSGFERSLMVAQARPWKGQLRAITPEQVEQAIQRQRPDLWRAVTLELGGRQWLRQQFQEVQRELTR